MDNRELFHKAVSVLESEGSAALVTVTTTVGSTPGKPGYRMLVFSGGHKTDGTVGGGAVEARMIVEAASMLGQSKRAFANSTSAKVPTTRRGFAADRLSS